MGIANHEEYSLIHDLPPMSEKEKSLTLKKDKTLNRDHKKMEELKKKLHTDDDSEFFPKDLLFICQNFNLKLCLINLKSPGWIIQRLCVSKM
jgi:hypothetical protein